MNVQINSEQKVSLVSDGFYTRLEFEPPLPTELIEEVPLLYANVGGMTVGLHSNVIRPAGAEPVLPHYLNITFDQAAQSQREYLEAVAEATGYTAVHSVTLSQAA